MLALVKRLGEDPKVHGILVQLPMPNHINEEAVLNAVPITKDVDGFHPVNIGKLGMKNREPSFEPCTPAGVIELLDRIGTKIEGANAVVLGRSNIVGLPVSLLLLGRNATRDRLPFAHQGHRRRWYARPIFWWPRSGRRSSSKRSGSSPARW